MNAIQTLPSAPSRPRFLQPEQAEDALAPVLRFVEKRPPSFISDHGTDCCRCAKAWFHCLAASAAAQHTGPPTWIRKRWEWGPMEWPLHWCQIPSLKTLDCGALAALAQIALRIAEKTVFPVQLLEHFDPSAVEQWRAAWAPLQSANLWTWESIAYHEAAGILDRKRFDIWDPTDGHFVETSPTQGYSSILAVRFNNPSPATRQIERGAPFRWNGHPVELNRWVQIHPRPEIEIQVPPQPLVAQYV